VRTTSHNESHFDELTGLPEEPYSERLLGLKTRASAKREAREQLEEGLRILARVIARKVLSEPQAPGDKPQYVSPLSAPRRPQSRESKSNKGVA
jgi:hypothetical protein